MDGRCGERRVVEEVLAQARPRFLIRPFWCSLFFCLSPPLRFLPPQLSPGFLHIFRKMNQRETAITLRSAGALLLPWLSAVALDPPVPSSLSLASVHYSNSFVGRASSIFMMHESSSSVGLQPLNGRKGDDNSRLGCSFRNKLRLIVVQRYDSDSSTDKNCNTHFSMDTLKHFLKVIEYSHVYIIVDGCHTHQESVRRHRRQKYSSNEAFVSDIVALCRWVTSHTAIWRNWSTLRVANESNFALAWLKSVANNIKVLETNTKMIFNLMLPHWCYVAIIGV